MVSDIQSIVDVLVKSPNFLIIMRPTGHTCHVVGENLLLIGGMATDSDGQNVQTCSQTMPTEIFNLALQTYTDVYDASGASRAAPVPSPVVSVIGGTPTGGAEFRTPKVWNDAYLQYIFDPSLERPAYTAPYTLANETTNNSTSASNDVDHGPSTATVVGAAVGGALGAALLIGAIVAFFVSRKARRKRRIRATPIDASNRWQAKTDVMSTTLEGNGGKLRADPERAQQIEPTELDSSWVPSELESNSDPVELTALPAWSDIPLHVLVVPRGVS